LFLRCYSAVHHSQLPSSLLSLANCRHHVDIARLLWLQRHADSQDAPWNIQDFIALLQQHDQGTMDWTYLAASFHVLKSAWRFLGNCAVFNFVAWGQSRSVQVCLPAE
jgi:hypothetical protein